MPRSKTNITLKRRSEFVAMVSHGRKWSLPSLVLQTGPLPKEASATPALYYGITASKKVGNAVARNRAKRRLRALVRDVMHDHVALDRAYVLIAKTATVTLPYATLRADLEAALKKLKAWESPQQETPA